MINDTVNHPESEYYREVVPDWEQHFNGTYFNAERFLGVTELSRHRGVAPPL